jgi:hypothetical protein
VHWDRRTGLFFVFIEPVVYLLQIVVLSCERLTGDRDNANRVFVDIFIQPFGRQSILVTIALAALAEMPVDGNCSGISILN